jgi:hypothetical protein
LLCLLLGFSVPVDLLGLFEGAVSVTKNPVPGG